MASTFNTILDAALQLPEVERLALVDRLMATLPVETDGLSLYDENIFEELDRRATDRDGAVPWEQLRDRA